MARPSALDTSALTVSYGKAPARSTLVSGPIADGVRHTIANPGQDAAFTVTEAQVLPLISKIRNTIKTMGYGARITTVEVKRDLKTNVETEVPVRQGDIKKDGKRTIKVYFRGRGTAAE